MPCPRLALVLLASLLLPSCVWNIGENILTARETRVALDYSQPVDGKLYRVARKGKEPRYYARLAEVRYRVMPALVTLDLYDHKGYAVHGVEFTGRQAFAEVKLNRYSAEQPEKRAIDEVLQEVSVIPDAAEMQPYMPERFVPLSPDTIAVRDAETVPGWPRRAVASTLSYTIDPFLSLVCSTAFVVGSTAATIVASPFCWGYWLCVEQAPVEQAPDCMKKTEPAVDE